MSDTEKPAGAGDADGLHDLPARTGLDDLEDKAIAIGRKLDLEDLHRRVAELMTGLGDAEHDDEQRRRYREFLVRLLQEPLQAVGLELPQCEGGEHRVMVMFCAEPCAVPYYISGDLVSAGLLAALLRRLNDCVVHIEPASEAEAGT